MVADRDEIHVITGAIYEGLNLTIGKGDLLFGSNNSQIATLVERQTRYVMLARVKSKDTETVINTLIKQAHKFTPRARGPRELYKSLTWDRGKEMADHKRFSLATDIKVTSVIHKVPGNGVQTKTPTDCCGSTSQKEWISPTFTRTG